MTRWLGWFVLVPQSYLLVGFLRDLGLPQIDLTAFAALFLAWFAQVRALPLLLLGVAIGRALVEQATLPVHVLVIGVPVAVLLPLRSMFVAQRWVWQAFAAALLAVLVPKLSSLFGRMFDQPPAAGGLDAWSLVWAALVLPPLLWGARSLPPFRAFVDDAQRAHGERA